MALRKTQRKCHRPLSRKCTRMGGALISFRPSIATGFKHILVFTDQFIRLWPYKKISTGFIHNAYRTRNLWALITDMCILNNMCLKWQKFNNNFTVLNIPKSLLIFHCKKKHTTFSWKKVLHSNAGRIYFRGLEAASTLSLSPFMAQTVIANMNKESVLSTHLCVLTGLILCHSTFAIHTKCIL